MLSKLISWTCPLCHVDDATIVRGSQDYLDVAVADHILRIHEERAALRAVDKARLSCRSTTCEIGRANHMNLSIGNPSLALTEFDRVWLQAMKVGAE